MEIDHHCDGTSEDGDDLMTFETFPTRSMKVLETMKPAMKAKQIIMEFAIDRTWKHDVNWRWNELWF